MATVLKVVAYAVVIVVVGLIAYAAFQRLCHGLVLPDEWDAQARWSLSQ